MGNGAALWDDSALIKAFDAAMASYKEMHGISSCDDASAPQVEVLDSEGKEDFSLQIYDVMGHLELGRNSDGDIDERKGTYVSSCNSPATSDAPPCQDKDVSGNVPAVESNSNSMDPTSKGYCNQQTLDYNELLNQYYELEQRKQKVVEQLWQANYWNYQTLLQGSTSQVQQIPVCGCSKPGPITSGLLCMCHGASTMIPFCPIASLMSSGGYGGCPQCISCCSGYQIQEAGAHCSTESGRLPMHTSGILDPKEHSAEADHNSAIQAGITEEEWATNPIKEDAYISSNLHEEKQKEESYDSIKFGSQDLSSSSSKTDLTAVINAWYWAGYQTGRQA
ncbi:hypothetical protein AXF42_Ash002023 [Apostasia shenzhenica]|uniref:Survival Motor Neuron Gemin2-binding domain-containing protein n=1 Tax=Apostasia shenzhenica TaxID=1088818 RepID=A0A2I0ABW5_9ASPA|nr:hypothetical protein AXF42_Ash002023 [Apostasia shenzhenica]